MRSSRGSCSKHIDCIKVWDGDQLVVHEAIGPGGLLHPKSSAEAPPWFGSVSPFGPWIYGLTWERHWERQNDTQERLS